MLSEEERAAAEERENWHIMKVYRTGPHLWRIDYGTPDGPASPVSRRGTVNTDGTGGGVRTSQCGHVVPILT